MNENISALVDELFELGVRDIVLSPGSRSTPLSTLFCAYEKFSVYMNLDERSAGFFALGIAKEQNKPVVVVCTSGSALAHYLPAVIEAKYSKIPLIILSADRPAQLQNIGADQTINQNTIFGNYIKFQTELCQIDYEKSFAYARLQVRNAYLNAQSVPKGAVQINVPLEEPLLPSFDPELYNKAKQKTFQFVEPSYQIDFSFENLKGKNGIIICGAGSADYSIDDRLEILKLAEKLQLPILADPLSQMRSLKSTVIIDSYDIFLKNTLAVQELKPDYLLLFGQSPVSKRLQNFIKGLSVDIYQINQAANYRNPGANTTDFVQASMGDFARHFNQRDFKNANADYLQLWKKWEDKALNKLAAMDEENEFFEGEIVKIIQKNILPDSNLCLANSMTIRDVDYFWRAKEQAVKTFCNRGANGIEGIISTAIGLATKKWTVLLSGDLSFWHDLNGLLLAKTHELNLVIVLINNDGAGIFQYLPYKNCQNFDYLFRTSHGVDFSGLKTLYGLDYYEVNSAKDFEEKFIEVQGNLGISLLEVKIDMESSVNLHKKYTEI